MVPLPPYARRVEYLESTGTQWIDTGVYGGSDTVTKARVYWPYQNQIQGIVFGSLYIDANSLSHRYMLQRHASKASFYTGKNTIPAAIVVSSGWYDTELNAPGKFVSVNGQRVSKTVASYSLTKPTIGLFARRTASDKVSPTTYGVDNISVAGVRVASCEIFSGSTPVRSFVPCRILDVGYLWDEVEGKFYGNQGTGDFVLGADVREGVVPTPLNPFGIGRRQEKIRRVEYLESTGTQYVDTGVIPPSSPRVEMTVMPINRACILAASYYSRDGAYRNFGVSIPPRGAISLHYNASTAGSDIVINNGGVSFLNTVVSFTADGNSFTAFGTTKTDSSWTIEPGSSCTIGMFARHLTLKDGTERWESFIKMRVYSCRIYDGSTLVRDFVPVRVGSVGYLLDKVSGRLFGNKGTGNFVCGGDL